MTPLNNKVNDLFNGGGGSVDTLSSGPLALPFLSVLCLIQPIECENATSGLLGRTPVDNLQWR